MKDAKDQGKEAVEILREHHLGESKPRIVSLYGELASLKMEATENTLTIAVRPAEKITNLSLF